MGENDWQSERLIPTSGINGQQQQEMRATARSAEPIARPRHGGCVEEVDLIEIIDGEPTEG